MCTIMIGIVAAFLSVLIVILALSIGGYIQMLKYLRYIKFPPAIFYFNAITAIEQLEYFGITSQILINQSFKQGIIRSSDVGFKELTKILQEKGIFNGEAEEIRLGEYQLDESGLYEVDDAGLLGGDVRLTPDKIEILILIQAGKKITLQRDINPNRITQNLRDWTEEVTRNHVANWILIVLGLYLIASICLIVIK